MRSHRSKITLTGASTAFALVAFAALVTIHVATVFGLAKRKHVAAAIGSFFVPPLAPYCAFARGMRVRALAWFGVALLYVIALVLAW